MTRGAKKRHKCYPRILRHQIIRMWFQQNMRSRFKQEFQNFMNS